MKKTIKALKLPSIFLLLMVSFIACDKDFSIIESDVLGKENSNFETNNLDIPIVAYNKKLDSLQINGLASNLLGVFNDPAFGLTTASIVTQVTPALFNPNFGVNPEIDEVIINIPYFSTQIGVDDDGNATYALDSLYGDATTPIKLTIYQNNYFLRDFDPNSELNTAQNYYSNANSSLNSALTGTSVVNFDDHIVATIYEDPEFIPSAEAIVITTGTGNDEVTTRSVPAYRIVLDTDEDKLYWTNTIISKQDDPVLSNPNNFKNYFRGLYFKAESIGTDGNMVLINLASSTANISINYTSGETDARTQSTYTLNFTGNRLNTFINDYNLVTLQNGNKDLGDEKLYLKGIEGSMAVVNLFEDEDALQDFINEYRIPDGNGDYLKENNTGDFILRKIINEVQLIVHEDEIMETFPKDANDNDYSTFDRVYAYDIKNNIPTIDYLIDPTENAQQALSSKVISLGQRFEDDKNNFKYKIRLTEHIKNILLKDSTNTKIGLVLSTNVNYTNISRILESEVGVTGIPAAALLSPRGTIIYGTNTTDEDKRMKLKIYLTEPKGN
tara:strand:- start:424 stop:2094 length:1671 start_codon:yes stop_codon:yes gene_type:complete